MYIYLGYPFLSVAGLFVRFGAISIQLFTSQVLVVKLVRLWLFFQGKTWEDCEQLMSNYLREMKASILNKLFCTLVTWLHHKKQPSWTEQYIRETFSKRDCSTILTVIFRAQNPTVEEEEVSNCIFNSSKKKSCPFTSNCYVPCTYPIVFSPSTSIKTLQKRFFAP